MANEVYIAHVRKPNHLFILCSWRFKVHFDISSI